MNRTGTVYADYQATTPLDPYVRECMDPFWNESFGNPHSTDHITGWQAEKAVNEARASVASLIGADKDEIIFTSGATEANNLALFGLARHMPLIRNRIIVSAVEHKCVLAAARALSVQSRFIIETAPVNDDGMIDLDALQASLNGDVLLVSIMAVNNEVGSIQDIPRIAELLSSYDIPLHCDAAQAPCAVDISGLAKSAEMISLSGHKFYGPQGIGALYIRRDLQGRVEPLIYGGGQQNGLRSGTVPLPLCVGMGAAADMITNSKSALERARIARQRDRFIHLLMDAGPSITVNGPGTNHRHPGNANLCFHGYDAQSILSSLQPKVAASTGAACTSGLPEPSHVLHALGLSTEDSDASIRFSFGRFTTEQDIDKASTLVLQTLESLSLHLSA
ncbi:MAG: cysteine desulfurase family protein [Gammaproteobacteria bacterium]|nr:cysteine desulfurase family protein [Gammaproteobacteria bacterium]